MKNFKVFIPILFIIAQLFLLASCGGDKPCSHLDKNGDLICDKCDYEYPEDSKDEEEEKTVLIEDGEPCFAIVIPEGCPGSLRMLISELQEYFEELGTSLTVVEETKESGADIEVLLGSVASRGKKYEYDRYSLGYKGYAITPFDDEKIAVTGGSDEALISAFELFVSDYLGIDYESDEIEDVSIKEDEWTVEVFTNYRVKKILVGNTEITDYTIVRDKTNREHSTAAEKLQSFFYEKAGYYLPIVNSNEDYENAIIFKTVAKNEAGDKGFRVRVDGKNLVIECAYNSMFNDAFGEFYQKFFIANETVTLTDFIPEKDISRVYYKDFGAVGDGKTNDFEAIKKAHEIANASGQSVCAEAGATYYIEKTNGTIEIKTDTDFKGASFIFDDSALVEEDSGHIFTIKSDYNDSYIDKNNDYIKALNENKNKDGYVLLGIDHGDKQTTKIDLGLGYPALITIYNDNHRNYLRYGSLANIGSTQKEIVLIDKDGNVDPSTPLLFDYTQVTKITISRIDDQGITVKNGNFTSLANRVNLYGGSYYLARGICIMRPNTVIDGLTHKITGEIPKNAPTKLDSNGLSYDVSSSGFTYENNEIKLNGKTYKGDDVKPFTAPSFRGFIYIDQTHNILVKNCVLQARVHYVQGTYDINVENSNQVFFENCTQSNFFDTSKENSIYGESTVTNLGLCWGIAGTSYSKNLEYHSSRLTRYDAHAGVLNGKVIDSEIAVFRLIGGGNFVIEGTTVYAGWNAPIQFREDYGATFNGTITIKDTHFIDGIYSKNGKKTNFTAIFEASSPNWDFGYTCHFPNLILDNITTDSALTELILISSTTKTYPTDLYPKRNIFKEPVYDPDALLSSYLSFKDPEIFEKRPQYFKHLEGLELGKDYTIVEQSDGVFTVVAHNVKNICTYVPPEFITIRNMDNFKNSEKKDMKFLLYTSDFFKNTTITDEDGVIVRRKLK